MGFKGKFTDEKEVDCNKMNQMAEWYFVANDYLFLI